jgi:exonuclease III/ribonuclease HI
VQRLIEEHNPDVLILTETLLNNKQKQKGWVHLALGGYSHWAATHNVGNRGGRGVVIAIKKHLADLGRPIRRTDKDDMGRVLHITLNLPNSRPLGITGVYAPAGNSPPEQEERDRVYALALAHAEADQTEAAAKGKTAVHLLAGDWNAVLATTDRASGVMAPQDDAHTAFVLKAGAHSLDAHNPARPHTFRPVFEDGERHTSSRIDDIMLCGVHSGVSARVSADDTATLSDHVPLIARIDTMGTGLFIPSHKAEPNTGSPTRVLAQPISKEDFESSKARIESETVGQGKAIKSLSTELTNLLSAEVLPHLTAIEATDGRQATRLTRLANDAAPATVERLAGKLAEILKGAHELALATCATTMTNPGKVGHLPRKQSRTRQRLVMQLQTLRGIYENASGDDDRGAVTTRILNQLESHPTTRDNTIETWQTTCEAAEDERGDESVHALLARAIRSTKHQIKSLDAEHSKLRSLEAIQKKRKQMDKNPKRANRTIFKTRKEGAPPGRCLALQDPVTGIVTDDPKHTKAIVEQHFRALGRPPSGHKHGTYQTTSDARTDYPWERPGAVDSFKLETGATNLATRPWLHNSINDKAAFDRSINKLANGKTPGPDTVPNEILKMLPDDLKECIRQLFIIMWATGTTPTAWKESQTILLYKDKGDITDITKYRPVGLLNTVYKLWTRHITTAMADYAETYQILSPNQKGFRQASTTMQQAQTIIMALEDARATNQNIYMLAVDFSSAFNMLDQDKLLQIMFDLGFPTDAVDAVRSLYEGATTSVRWGQDSTPPIPMERGSIQGDSLSPLLFLLYIEPLLRWIHVGGRGYRFGCLPTKDRTRHQISALAYADDLNCFTTTVSDLRVQAQKLNTFASEFSLPINGGKTVATAALHRDVHTKLCTVTEMPRRVARQLEGQLQIQGEHAQPIGPRDPFRYLGVLLTMMLDWGPQHRANAQTLHTKLQQARDSHGRADQIQRLVQRSVMPAITYAMGVVPHNRNDLKVLDVKVGTTIKAVYGLPRSAPSTMVHEDIDRFGMGITSLAVPYATRSAQLLISSLQDEGTLGKVTRALLELQLPLFGGANKSTTKTMRLANYCMRVRQLALMTSNDLAIVEKGCRIFSNRAQVMEVVRQLNPTHHALQDCDFLAPLFEIGITHLGELVEPGGSHILTGKALTALRKHVGTPQVVALNHLAALLSEPPAEGAEPRPVRPVPRRTDKSLNRAERRIHPDNIHLTALATPDEHPNVATTVVSHPDQHLITEYTTNLAGQGSPQQANLVNAPADPPGTTQARDTHPTTEGPEATQDTAHRDEGHQGRGPSRAQPIRRLPKQIQRRIPKAPATFGHDYKQQTATSVFTKLTRQSTNNTEQACAGALTEALHGDAYHPESLRGWQVVTEDQHGTTRIKQSQYLVRWLPNTIEAWALGLYKKAGHLIERTEPVLPNTTPLLDEECTCEICWRAASKTHDGRHTDMPVCDECDKTYHTACIKHCTHYHAPSEDETEQWRCPACSDPNNTTPPPDAPLVRAFWADAWETEENLSVDPGMAAAIKEWNTVYKDQAPARQSADALDKDLTNSERQGMWADAGGKWISTHGKPVRSKLIASTRPTRPGLDIPPGENCRVQTMEVELWKRPPTRRAEDPLPPRPTTHRSTLACVFTRDGSCVGMTSLARLDTMRRMHRQHSGAAPNREHDFASRTVDLFRAVTLAHRHAPKSQRALAPQAVDGRIMSVLKQHLHVTQERYATPLTAHGHPLTYWSTNPIDAAFGARIDPYSVPWEGASVAFPPPTAAAQRRAVRWALMSAMHSDVAVATILILPRHASDKGGNTYNELLKLLPELCTPVTTIVGLPTTTNVAWDGTDTPATATGWRTDILIISNPTGRTGPVWTLAGTTGLLAALRGACAATPDQGRMRVCYEMQPSNTKHLGTCWGKASPGARAADDAGGGILCMTKDFRAARERQQLEPTAAPPTTEHDWPEGLGTDPTPPCAPLHQWDALTYTDASRRRVKLPCGRAVIRLGAAVYTPHDGHRVRTVDPGHNPDGDTANHAELVAIHAAIADAREVDQPPPIVTDCAAAIDQIINVVHQPAKLTFHRHKALLQRIYDLLEKRADRQQGPIELLKVAAHSGDIGNSWADMGAKWAASQTTYDVPAPQRLHSARDDTAWPYRVVHTNDQETLTPHEEQEADAQHRHPPGLKPLLSTGDGIAQHMHTRHRLGAANTDSAYYTFWQQILGDTEGTISNAYLTSRAITHAQRRTVLKYRYGQLWNNKLALRYKFSDTDKCPLCHQTDGGGHIASGCQDPIMKRMYTERHNKAGRILLDAIYNGARGSDICMADVGSQQRCEDDGAPYVGLNHVPAEMLPPQADQGTEEHARWLRTKRPDIMLCNTQGHSQEDRAQHDICIVELKTCQDTRPTDQLTAARLQHEELVERLVQRGYQRDKIKIYPILLGVSGTIYAAHTIDTLEQLGVQRDAALSCARKLHTLMVQQLHSVVTTRRHLEHRAAPG